MFLFAVYHFHLLGEVYPLALFAIAAALMDYVVALHLCKAIGRR